MTTKIVYALVSSENDTYLEQTLLSMYSLRLHNKNAYVILMVDTDTKKTLSGKRSIIETYTNELIVVSCPEEYTPKEKSRFIKTTVRQRIKGDFLFVDSDTIIVDDISDIDNFKFSLGCVSDLHGITLINKSLKKNILININKIFNRNFRDISFYFNSGVIYVKDIPENYLFYKRWNENWHYSSRDKGVYLDQPSLYITNYDLGCMMKEMDNSYNCQIKASVKYFFNAKIVHIFNQIYIDDISRYFNGSVYLDIKNIGVINDQIKYELLDFKKQIELETCIIGVNKRNFLESRIGRFGLKIYNSWLCKKIRDIKSNMC